MGRNSSHHHSQQNQKFPDGLRYLLGVFMLIALMGGAKGLQQMLSRQFEGFATNSGFLGANKTSKAYKGFQQGRYWDLENKDVERVRKQVNELETVTATLANGASMPFTTRIKSQEP